MPKSYLNTGQLSKIGQGYPYFLRSPDSPDVWLELTTTAVD